MQITVDWDNLEQTTILQVYSATWNWVDYVKSFKRIDELASEVLHPLAIIAEIAAVKTIARDVVFHSGHTVRILPSNVFLSVAVMPSRLSLSILDALQGLTKLNIRVVSTIEEARQLIEVQRATLPLT